MTRFGVLCFISQRTNAICQSVTHQCMRETRAWFHEVFPLRHSRYLDNACAISKMKSLPSCFMPIVTKPYSNNDTNSYSSSANNSNGSSEGDNVKLSQKQKLKIAVRDYGAVVIIFHVGISLLSLAGFYLAIANGVDVISLLQKMGLSDYAMNNKLLLEGSTFVIAYGIHKLFAPARIAITLSTAPFIVRYLRKIQILKPSKSK